jgi:hypothetical protein
MFQFKMGDPFIDLGSSVQYAAYVQYLGAEGLAQ